MPTLYQGDHIAADLERIAGQNGQADADDLLAFLDELAGREEALWQLVKHHAERTYPSPTFNSKMIEMLLQEGYNIGRIRPVPRLSKYRILYAYDNEYDDIYALGIVEKLPHTAQQPDYARYYNYERDHPVTARVIDEYDGIAIPRIPPR